MTRRNRAPSCCNRPAHRHPAAAGHRSGSGRCRQFSLPSEHHLLRVRAPPPGTQSGRSKCNGLSAARPIGAQRLAHSPGTQHLFLQALGAQGHSTHIEVGRHHWPTPSKTNSNRRTPRLLPVLPTCHLATQSSPRTCKLTADIRIESNIRWSLARAPAPFACRHAQLLLRSCHAPAAMALMLLPVWLLQSDSRCGRFRL